MNARRQLAFLCHPYHRGGVTRWMVDAAANAASAGHAVWFVTVQPSAEFHNSGGREPIWSLLQPHNGSITVVTESAGYEFEFGTEQYRAAIYAKLIRNGVPSGVPVIISDDRAVWAGAAAVADRNPMIGVLHCDDPYYYEIGRLYKDQMAACVCVSERVRRLFLHHCPDVPVEKVSAIPCGINLPPVRSQDERVIETTRLVFIGRFNDEQKRAGDLVKIAGALVEQDFQFHLDIAGNDAVSGEEYSRYFEEVGAGDKVTFNGWLSAGQVNDLLSRADVLVLTSNFEGTPLVMMEALAAGCGFAGTRVSGIEDYEHHEFAADCFRSFDVGDIAEAVKKIREISAIPVVQRRAAARKLAEAEFSMDVCLERYYSVVDAATTAGIAPVSLHVGRVQMIRSRAMALARMLKVSLKK
ncbi:MAG: glycosyltransferase family 4 protein [Chitinophagaceae bacterium]|nr:glycosyltransferase family 4 protein [Chitinophagaceae bacterium]